MYALALLFCESLVLCQEDAELACDTRVLKDSSLEDRKNYGFALLELLEHVQSEKQNLRFTTSVSSSSNNMKRRIQKISNRSITKKYILFPVILVLILLMVVGCVYPSNKSYIKTSAWENYDEEKIKEMFADYNIVTFVRLILSDLPSEKLYEQMQMKEFPVKGV